MPLHDYRCPDCDLFLRDQYTHHTEIATKPLPICEACGATMYRVQGCGRMDAKEPFQRFSVDVNGRSVEVASLAQVRKIEAQTEQAYRNGEGEPLRFRAYANDRSNLDRNTFGSSGKIGDQAYSDGQRPQTTEERAASRADQRRKLGLISTKRHGSKAPTVALGPGMRGRAASPLS